jgi:hypothetical protein
MTQPPAADEPRGASPPKVDASPGLVRDFGRFLWESKAWWLVPLLLAVSAVLAFAWLTREPPRPPTYPHF